MNFINLSTKGNSSFFFHFQKQMRTRKRKQNSQYVGDATLPPELNDTDENEKYIRKRLKTTHNISYLPYFDRSMSMTLSSAIKAKISKSMTKVWIET